MPTKPRQQTARQLEELEAAVVDAYLQIANATGAKHNEASFQEFALDMEGTFAGIPKEQILAMLRKHFA